MNTETVVAQATTWLTEILHAGPVPHTMIMNKSPYAPTTLKRAAQQLGVISRNQRGMPRTTTWELPHE